MKRATIILLSMFLVFSIGQAAFANHTLGFIVGYGNKNQNYSYYGNEKKETIDVPLIGIYGEHEYIEGCFVSFKEKFSIGKLIEIESYNYQPQVNLVSYNPSNAYRTELEAMEIYFDLFLKMNIFSLDKSRVGLQVGVMNDYLRLRNTNYSPPSYNLASARNVEKLNTFFWAFGAYADVQVSPQMSVYGDLKIPIFVAANDNFKELIDDQYLGFFKSFLYDLTLGFTYDISTNVYLGFEGTITNSTVYDLIHYTNKSWGPIYERTFPGFNIGATVGYRF